MDSTLIQSQPIPIILNKCIAKLESRRVPNGSQHLQLLSYKVLYRQLYKPYGFLLDPRCETEPWLSLIPGKQNDPHFCINVFSDWLSVNNKSAPNPPPNDIPLERKAEYLLNNNVGYKKWYFNDHSGANIYKWPKSLMEDLTKRARNNENIGYYGAETQIVLQSAASISMTGLSAAVIGSISPWVEAILLINNVSSILTFDYSRIISEDSRLSYAHPQDFAKNYITSVISGKRTMSLGLIASFSSLEHAGMGRYGDVLDPWGDVREMQKAWCLLKPGGIFMLGVPEDYDRIDFNAQRVYGPIRLPMMTAGFEIVSVFDKNGPVDLSEFKNAKWPMLGYSQRMIVLKKRE